MHRNLEEALHTRLLVIMFFFGAVQCGFIVKQSTLRLGRRYGVALTFEAVLLFVAVRYLDQGVIV